MGGKTFSKLSKTISDVSAPERSGNEDKSNSDARRATVLRVSPAMNKQYPSLLERSAVHTMCIEEARFKVD